MRSLFLQYHFIAPSRGPNPTPLITDPRNLNDCKTQAAAAANAETGKILSGDWVGTTAAGVAVRAATIGGVTAPAVIQGATISFAGRALYYGAKALFQEATTGGACAISVGTTSLFNSVTGLP